MMYRNEFNGGSACGQEWSMWMRDLSFFSFKNEVKVRFCCWLQPPDEEWGGIRKMKLDSSQRCMVIG